MFFAYCRLCGTCASLTNPSKLSAMWPAYSCSNLSSARRCTHWSGRHQGISGPIGPWWPEQSLNCIKLRSLDGDQTFQCTLFHGATFVNCHQAAGTPRARHWPIHSRCSRLLEHVGDRTFPGGTRSVGAYFPEAAQQPQSINVEDVHRCPPGRAAAGKPSLATHRRLCARSIRMSLP